MSQSKNQSGMIMTAVLGAIGRGHLTVDQIADHLPIERKKVVRAAAALIRNYLIERVEIGHYRLSGAGIETLKYSRPLRSGPRGKLGPAPRTSSFRQRAWTAMRLQGRFTVGDVVTLAASSRERRPEQNLYRYIAALVKVGIVAELPARAPGNAESSPGFKVFRLIRNTGEFAPSYDVNEKVVYDHNTMERLPCA